MNNIAANIVKGLINRIRIRRSARHENELVWLKKKLIKHQDDKSIKTFSFKGLKVSYKRPYELLHTYHDVFVNEIYKFKSTVSNPVIIDCGANIGLSMLYFKQLYPQAQLIVFEPDETNFNLLTQNCQLNRLNNVQLNKAAVWISNGSISFEAQESEASHIYEDGTQKGIQVDCIRLSDVIKAQQHIHFLKLDIEGAEWKVMKDATDQLYKVDNLFLEYHGKADETYKLADLFALLESVGFCVYIKMAADNLTHPFIQKSTKTIYDIQLNIFCYRNK